MSISISTRLQFIISNLLILSMVACQTVTPNTASKVPQTKAATLPVSPGRSLPDKLRQEVIRRKGNLANVQVMTPVEMKAYEVKRQASELTPLQKHFALTQVPNQVPCDDLEICDYQQIGQWQEYYNSMYGGSNGQTCAFETLSYCGEDNNNPGCFVRYNEMRMYGCVCNEGTVENEQGQCAAEFQVKVSQEPSLSPELPSELMLTPDADTHHDWIRFDVYPDNVHPWNFTIRDAQNQTVYSYEGSNTENRYFHWDGRHFDTNKILPNGIYTVFVKSNEKEFKFNINMARQLRFRAYTSVTQNEPPDSQALLDIYPSVTGSEHAYVSWSVFGVDKSWTFKVLDQSGSAVWYSRGSDDFQGHWSGRDMQGTFVPEGIYTLQLNSRNIVHTASVRVNFEATNGLALYYDSSVKSLLDSVEKRLGIMQRDVDIMMQITQSLPNAPTFTAQSLPDLTSFRIQQQDEPILPPADLSAFSESTSNDVSKVHAEAQNLRIVLEVVKLRQKVNWMKQVMLNASQNAFMTQQTSEGQMSSTALEQHLKKLERINGSFYGIDTTGGCYNFYSFKARWKKKRANEAAIQISSMVLYPDLSMKVKGSIEDDRSAQSNEITLTYQGLDSVASTPATMTGGNTFEANIPMSQYTKLDPEATVFVTGSYCPPDGACVSSSPTSLTPYEPMGVFNFQTDADPDFSVQSNVSFNPNAPVTRKTVVSPVNGANIKLDLMVNIEQSYLGYEDKDSTIIGGTSAASIVSSRNDIVHEVPSKSFSGAYYGTYDKYYQFIGRNFTTWNAKRSVDNGCGPQNKKNAVVPAGVYSTAARNIHVDVITPEPARHKLVAWLNFLRNGGSLHGENNIRITHACPARVLYNKEQYSTGNPPVFQSREFQSGGAADLIGYYDNLIKIKIKQMSGNPPMKDGGDSSYTYIDSVMLSGGKLDKSIATKGKKYEDYDNGEVLINPASDDDSQRRFLPPDMQYQKPGEPPRGPQRFYDAERNALEYFAHKFGNAKFYSSEKCDFKVNTGVHGQLNLYSDRESCQFCAEMAWQMRTLYPNLNLNWVDREGQCY